MLLFASVVLFAPMVVAQSMEFSSSHFLDKEHTVAHLEPRIFNQSKMASFALAEHHGCWISGQLSPQEDQTSPQWLQIQLEDHTQVRSMHVEFASPSSTGANIPCGGDTPGKGPMDQNSVPLGAGYEIQISSGGENWVTVGTRPAVCRVGQYVDEVPELEFPATYIRLVFQADQTCRKHCTHNNLVGVSGIVINGGESTPFVESETRDLLGLQVLLANDAISANRLVEANATDNTGGVGIPDNSEAAKQRRIKIDPKRDAALVDSPDYECLKEDAATEFKLRRSCVHGYCEGNVCVCEERASLGQKMYVGQKCDVESGGGKASINAAGGKPCYGNGKLLPSGYCDCKTGYGGAFCDRKVCPEDCNGNGVCAAGACICDKGWIGLSCGEKTCTDNCNFGKGQGKCNNGTCDCTCPESNPLTCWGGDTCQKKICPHDCYKHGVCMKGARCGCYTGWGGLECEKKACMNSCNYNGFCKKQKCECYPGFTGETCETRACPRNCSGRGQCIDAECVCDKGWGGWDCSILGCPNDCSAHGYCSNGTCYCESGWRGDGCDTRTCPTCEHGICVMGLCKCMHGWQGVDCNKVVPCPNECNGHGCCRSGKCACDPGWVGANCGQRDCLNSCGNNSKVGLCHQGTCYCKAGWSGVDCSKGPCYKNCSGNGDCGYGSKCVCYKGYAGSYCQNKLCPLWDEFPDCTGGRGQCSNKGVCECPPNYYGEACQFTRCKKDCSKHGKCMGLLGQCKCFAGFTGEYCQLEAMKADCPLCRNGGCQGGNCLCQTGFVGLQCDRPTDHSCHHGRYINTTCHCYGGWTGKHCDIPPVAECSTQCSLHGDCVAGLCVCNDGWDGRDCENKVCSPGCVEGQGHCFNGVCFCKPGFGGAACGDVICIGNCSNNGLCFNGECSCFPGWSGEDCSFRNCPSNCQGYGDCNKGKCHCYTGRAGTDCSTVLGTSLVSDADCSEKCVNGCLDLCHKVRTHSGVEASRVCYDKCTAKCLPKCLSNQKSQL